MTMRASNPWPWQTVLGLVLLGALCYSLGQNSEALGTWGCNQTERFWGDLGCGQYTVYKIYTYRHVDPVKTFLVVFPFDI